MKIINTQQEFDSLESSFNGEIRIEGNLDRVDKSFENAYITVSGNATIESAARSADWSAWSAESLGFFNELIKQSFDCPLCEDTGKVGYYREPDDWVEEECSCRTQVREELDTENYIYQSKD